MIRQETPGRIKWSMISAKRIVEIGIELDTDQPAKIERQQQYDRKKRLCVSALVDFSIRLLNGRTIDTDGTGGFVAQFHSFDGHSVLRFEEELLSCTIPDFTCECDEPPWCDHIEEIFHRAEEIADEVGRTHTNEIIAVIESPPEVQRLLERNFLMQSRQLDLFQQEPSHGVPNANPATIRNDTARSALGCPPAL